jgi:hypothetical protein
MSDISISFPPWMIAWFLLGEATPFITLVLMGLAAAFFFSRGTARVRRVRWLKWALAIVGGLWLGGISFWAAGLVDQIKTDIYQAQHHYRLDNATVLAGIDIPRGSWISLDEEGVLYGIETAPDAMVSIDRALWRGDIRLIPSHSRTTADRGVIKSATLAADAAIQGIPCRAGMFVEFSEYGGDLQHCTLTQRIGVTAEIDEGQGGKSTKDLACAADRDVWLRTFERRLLERCVLAEPATISLIACADGKEIVLPATVSTFAHWRRRNGSGRSISQREPSLSLSGGVWTSSKWLRPRPPLRSRASFFHRVLSLAYATHPGRSSGCRCPRTATWRSRASS